MVAVCKDLSAAAKRAIDRLRHADGESLQTPAQCDRTVRFDEQMDVIALHAEVQEAKSCPGNSYQCFTHGTENVVATQRRQILAGPERHVDRTVRIVRLPSSVGDAPSPGSRLTSSAFSPAAPTRRRSQLQLSSSAPHLNRAHITPSLITCQVRHNGTWCSGGSTGHRAEQRVAH